MVKEEKDRSDWDKCSVAQLKNELQARGLSNVGVKAKLIERLTISDEELSMEKSQEEILIDEDVESLHETIEKTSEIGANSDIRPISEKVEENPDGEREVDQAMLHETNSTLKEKDEDEIQKEEKGNLDQSDTGVTIETIGEVDDDEFGAAVAGLGDFEDREEKPEKEQKKTRSKKQKDIKDLKPLPTKYMCSWMIQEFTSSRDYCSLYIKPLSSKDVLGESMYEWANRAIYFCINHERNGKGTAVLNFLTEKECKEAKESLAESLGPDVKISHPSRHKENEMKKELSYKIHSSGSAESRLLIVEDVPENASEDEICVLFPGAITVSRPSAKQLIYTWHNEDYALPEDINKKYFVEFNSSKEVSEAIADGKEYDIFGQKLTVHSFEGFDKVYKETELKKREELRKKRREETERIEKEKLQKLKSKVMKDEERIEKCKQLQQNEQKRSEIEKDKEMPADNRKKELENISDEIIKIIHDIQQDTNYRKKLEMTVPEDESLMTPHTKSTMLKKRSKDKPRDKEPDSYRERDTNRRKSDTKHDGRSKSSRSASIDPDAKFKLTRKELTKRDHNEIRQEIDKMEEDTRGWWHLLMYKPKDPDFPNTKSDVTKFCSKYGKVMEVHFNNEKIFVRFNSYKGVAAAIRDLWGTQLTVEVPRINEKYRKKSNVEPRARRETEQTMQQNYHQMESLQEQMIKQQQQMLLQKQLEEQQLKQQQQQQQQANILQAAMQMMHAQPQMQAINQVGILGNVAQTSSLLGQPGAMGMMNTGTETSIPSLLGNGAVQPLMASSTDSLDNRSTSRSRRHSRTPERTRFDRRRSNISPERPGLLDAKRSRHEDASGGDSYNDVQSLTQTINSQVAQLQRLGGDPNALKGVLDSLDSLQHNMLDTNARSAVSLLGLPTNQPAMDINQSTPNSSVRPLLPTPSLMGATGQTQSAVVTGNTVQGYSGSPASQSAVAGIPPVAVQPPYAGYSQSQQQSLAKQPLLNSPYGHQNRLAAFRDGRL